jgi:cytochrome P450
LTNLLFSLLSDPLKLQKAQAEVDEAFQNITEDILPDEIITGAKLPYIEGCINEALRLFSVVPKSVASLPIT